MLQFGPDSSVMPERFSCSASVFFELVVHLKGMISRSVLKLFLLFACSFPLPKQRIHDLDQGVSAQAGLRTLALEDGFSDCNADIR